VLALFTKRWHTSRRHWRALLVEVFIPAILILIGFGFSRIQLSFSSPPRLLTPALLPWPQRLLVNQRLVRQSADDIQPQQLVEGLPMYEQGAFEARYKDYSGVDVGGY
jgi:hypothetical protein